MDNSNRNSKAVFKYREPPTNLPVVDVPAPGAAEPIDIVAKVMMGMQTAGTGDPYGSLTDSALRQSLTTIARKHYWDKEF